MGIIQLSARERSVGLVSLSPLLLLGDVTRGNINGNDKGVLHGAVLSPASLVRISFGGVSGTFFFVGFAMVRRATTASRQLGYSGAP